ncbi:MAG: HPr family phosphocarrier protein [Candidatus Goldbacteria bacterium]|nr:HPr family phosphocarrier protein [Candidatus Goldiibacteriota bacterium]
MQFSKKVKVINKLGFHLRAVAVFVKEAEKYKSTIKVRNNDIEADGKSIMGLMTLIASEGTEIEIKAEGPDSKEAVNNLVKIVQNKFGEEE